MPFPEILQNIRNRALLRFSRRKGDRFEESLSKSLGIQYRERSLCVIFRSFARPQNRYTKYFFERESFSCGLRLARIRGSMHCEERTREVGKVIPFAHVGGDRVGNVFQNITRKNAVERMIEPFARYTAAFGIHGKYRKRILSFFREHSFYGNSRGHRFDFRVRDVWTALFPADGTAHFHKRGFRNV